MQKVETTEAVFTALQRIKAGAPAYGTNFFPAPDKLQRWIAAGELSTEASPRAVLFFKKERGFRRVFFGAADGEALRQQFGSRPAEPREPLVMDLLEHEKTTDSWLPVIEASGFRRYAQLVRLTRAGATPAPPAPPGEARPVDAARAEVPGILELLTGAFDPYAEQIPELSEIERAVENRQILVLKAERIIAGLLFFETKGATSTVRYWLVAEPFRACHYGSALMRAYLAAHGATRRFTLWVRADNTAARGKYGHYGYAPDGLTDQILVNEMIRHEIHC